MVEIKELQKAIYQNKVDKGFNTTDVYMEFCSIYGELGEAFDAYIKRKDDLGEEFADVAIFLMGLCEILNIDLEKEILHKMQKNSKREYKMVDGIPIKVEELEKNFLKNK